MEYDLRKLTHSFRNLAASSPGTKKPLGSSSGSSDGKGYTESDGSGSYTPIPFRSEFMVPHNEDSKVNCKQTATSSPAGGELSYIVVSQFIVPDNEGSNCKQTATYGPVGGIDMSQFLVPHNEGSNCEQTTTYGPVGGIGMSQFIMPHINEGSKVNCEQTATYTPVGLSSGEDYYEDMFRTPVGLSSGKDYYGDVFQFIVPDNEGSKVNSKQTATYSPVSVMPMFRGPVTGEGSYREESQPSVPCKVCYQLDHPAAYCPYLRHIPQGAAFDRDNYEIACSCGNIFNAEKWVCTFCHGRRPLLKAKYCSICRSFEQHKNYECPKDKLLAARYKSIRDQLLSETTKKRIPYREVCSVRASEKSVL